MNEVQIHKEVERLDKKIDDLNLLVTKLVHILETEELPELSSEFKASYAKKLSNAIKEIKKGRVLHYKNISEFNKVFG